MWAEAQDIAEPLNDYWNGRGLYAEAAAWTDRVRLATEDTDGVPPDWTAPQGPYGSSSSGAQARRQSGQRTAG